MELYSLQVFAMVVSERSFSRAAEKLFRTQPAVSLAVQRLESDLGEKLIDRSARDLPELAAVWFTGARGGFLALLRQYLEARLRRGLFRAVPDLAAATRLVLELIVFWAVHRHWDAHPEAIEESTAKATVIRFVTGALVEEK